MVPATFVRIAVSLLFVALSSCDIKNGRHICCDPGGGGRGSPRVVLDKFSKYFGKAYDIYPGFDIVPARKAILT